MAVGMLTDEWMSDLYEKTQPQLQVLIESRACEIRTTRGECCLNVTMDN